MAPGRKSIKIKLPKRTPQKPVNPAVRTTTVPKPSRSA